MRLILFALAGMLNAAPSVEDAFLRASNAALLYKARAPRPRPGQGSSFQSAAGGAQIGYAYRPGSGRGRTAVFMGGLALPNSFDSYLSVTGSGQGAQYFLTPRGHAGSPWVPTQDVYTADAMDLARLVNLAASQSGYPVDLVLHSYGTLVFQRMLQLQTDAEAAQALACLRGGRVLMLGASTHYGSVETVAGPEYAQVAQAVRQFVGWLDAGDAWAAALRESARINPLLGPAVAAQLAGWKLQRETGLGYWGAQFAKVLQEHLSSSWPAEVDSVRRRIQHETAAAAGDPGWQEALLRRTNGTSQLEFTSSDVASMRSLGIRADVAYSRGDQLIPWQSERLLLDMLGIDSPQAPPPSGTSLQDPSGTFRFLMVEGDHYLPLNDPGSLERLLGM